MRRAGSETAIRAESFSRAGWAIPCTAAIAFERGVDMWKVATIGPVAQNSASADRLGTAGS